MAHVNGTENSEVLNQYDGVTQGDDSIYGYGGSDSIYGHGGDDSLKGGAGGDYLYGGSGEDAAWYVDSPTGVQVNLLSGIGSGGTAEGDRYFSIEDVEGSWFNDVLTGDSGNNVLGGWFGNDQIYGGDGADVVMGGFDDDVLKGGGGDDFIFGDSHLPSAGGNDLLYGGTGRDEMSGGAGGDSFVWHSTDETGLTENTADLIWVIDPVEGDRIRLSLIDADVYAAGNQAFTFIGTAAFSGTPGEIRYYHQGYDTYMQLQTGTSADVEGVIRIAGIVTPEASWFVL
jgi:serralysin